MRLVLALALAPPLALFACAAIPSFSLAPAADASLADGGGPWDGLFGEDSSPKDAPSFADAGDARDAVADARPLHVFVTSEAKSPADFSQGSVGTPAANLWCKKAGANVNQNSRWVAFLYEGTVSARTRINESSLGFFRVERDGGTGPQVFSTIRQDFSKPQVAIHDEHGEPIEPASTNRLVWIGSSDAMERCNDWASSSSQLAGMCGDSTSQGTNWEANAVLPCNVTARLYCFEQDP